MAHILVADDDLEQVKLQRKLLEALGHEVDTAISSPEALRMLKKRTPDLILADLRIPNAEDGLELIRNIRGSGYQGPMIAMSGWPDDLYDAPEEQLVSRVVVKGSARELLRTIVELLGAPPQ